MKNRKALGIAGAIALGVAAVTAAVTVVKKKTARPVKKRYLFRPEPVKITQKNIDAANRHDTFTDSDIRVEDPYEDAYEMPTAENTDTVKSFFKDVEVVYEDDEDPVTVTDAASEQVYVSEDQEIVIEAVVVGKQENVTEAGAEPEQESVTETETEPEQESVTEVGAAPEQESVTEVGAAPEQESVTEAGAAPEQESVTEAGAEPEQESVTETETEPEQESVTEAGAEPEQESVAEDIQVEDILVGRNSGNDEPSEDYNAWEKTPEPVLEFYEEDEEEVTETAGEDKKNEPAELKNRNDEQPDSEDTLLSHESNYDWVYNVDEHYDVKTDGTWVYCRSDETLTSTSVNKKGGRETINIADTFKNRITPGGYCILKYTGSESEIVIPSEINGKPVVAAMNTFRSNQNIKKVTVPASVEGLRRTFYSCYHLDRIIIEKGSRLTYELDAVMCGNNDMDSGTESTTICCTEDLIEFFKKQYKLGCPVVFEVLK